MSEKLNDNEDYYFNESGLLVFTKHFHEKRGYCCKSGCLHCPWNYKEKQKEARNEKNKTY